MSSASAKTASASGTIVAPWAAYCSSVIAEPSPAPAWMHTLWPWSVSSRTPDGVSATRYSSALISVGTPTFTGASFSVGGGGGTDDLAPAQGEPELDAVAGGAQVAARELLDLADPVAQRVAVAVEPPRGGLPLAVALDEGLERGHEVAAVMALAVLDRAEQRLAEQPQRVGVLQREQELERPEVAERRNRGGAVAVAAVAVGGRAQLARLERAAGLVVGLARASDRDGAAGAGGGASAERLAGALDEPFRDLEQLVVEEARHQRADEAAAHGDEPADRVRAERLRQRDFARLRARALAGRDDKRAHPAAEPERLEAAAELGALEVARDDRRQDVAGKAALGGVGDAPAQELERDDGHRLVEDQPVDLGQAARVLDRDEPGRRDAAAAVGRIARADRQCEAARREVRVARDEALAVAAAGALAQLGPERGDDLVVELAAERADRPGIAAPVEHERSAADERRERADDRVEAALGEHDPLQALLGGDRALQQRVLLVDEPRERLLGQGDERQLVRHLEQREAALVRRLDERLGHRLVREPGADPHAGEPVVGERRDELALALRAVQREPGRQQELTARQPRRRVRQLGDVHPAHGDVEVRLAGEDLDVEVSEHFADGEHARLPTCAASGATPPRGPAAGPTPSPRSARGRR